MCLSHLSNELCKSSIKSIHIFIFTFIWTPPETKSYLIVFIETKRRLMCDRMCTERLEIHAPNHQIPFKCSVWKKKSVYFPLEYFIFFVKWPCIHFGNYIHNSHWHSQRCTSCTLHIGHTIKSNHHYNAFFVPLYETDDAVQHPTKSFQLSFFLSFRIPANFTQALFWFLILFSILITIIIWTYFCCRWFHSRVENGA